MAQEHQTIRIKVTPEVARVVGRGASPEVQMMAARGTLPLSAKDLVTALFFLCHGRDQAIRAQALETLKGLPVRILAPVVQDEASHAQLLDFVARHRAEDMAVLEPLLTNPATATATLVEAARSGGPAVLSLVAGNDRRLEQSPEIVAAILENPHADRALKFRLGWQEPATGSGEGDDSEAGEESAVSDGEVDEEDLNLSKYQQALELGVSEKIKIALTGDKEWRSIFLKDANKLVSSAVLKNPRITDGEVLAVAKNKSSNEELIRLITLNNEWVKNYEIKKALIIHPKTPLPKALRYMNILGDKDLKSLSKSRGISQVLVNNARRMLAAKEKKQR